MTTLTNPDTTSYLYVLGCVTVGVITCVSCCSYLLKRRKRTAALKQQQDYLDLQTKHPTFPMRTPGAGAPILTGVRVIELATVVAGPSAARCLADHGAEVIKIEAPSGDMWRKYLKIIEKKRKTFVSSFEHVNFNKSSVVLDLAKGPEQLAQIKRLLASADVFVTNVRLPSLQKLGLDYASLKDTHPHLVYGHLSAWGLVGPGRGDPGYDFGAFWSRTGMSTLMNGPGTYSQYPGAFGDTITGMNLVGGILTQLRKKLTNGGFGALVETSLLRTGMWVNAPMILRQVATKGASDEELPEYRAATDRAHCFPATMAAAAAAAAAADTPHPEEDGAKPHEVYDQYVTHDQVRFAVLELGSPSFMAHAATRLQQAMNDIVGKGHLCQGHMLYSFVLYSFVLYSSCIRSCCTRACCTRTSGPVVPQAFFSTRLSNFVVGLTRCFTFILYQHLLLRSYSQQSIAPRPRRCQ